MTDHSAESNTLSGLILGMEIFLVVINCIHLGRSSTLFVVQFQFTME